MKTNSAVKVFATLQTINNGKLYQLTKSRVVIGSGISADIRINDPTVLKAHIEVQFLPVQVNLFSKYSSYLKAQALLKVLNRQGAKVFINQQPITGSYFLKDDDVITFGNMPHSFVFRFHEESPKQSQPQLDGMSNDLSTPNVATKKTHLKAPQRNLIVDFNGVNQMASQSVKSSIKVPKTIETINQQTPSRIRLLLHDDANIKKSYSPSICRYFSQINAKSLHILHCIEKFFPRQEQMAMDKHDDMPQAVVVSEHASSNCRHNI